MKVEAHRGAAVERLLLTVIFRVMIAVEEAVSVQLRESVRECVERERF